LELTALGEVRERYNAVAAKLKRRMGGGMGSRTAHRSLFGGNREIYAPTIAKGYA